MAEPQEPQEPENKIGEDLAAAWEAEEQAAAPVADNKTPEESKKPEETTTEKPKEEPKKDESAEEEASEEEKPATAPGSDGKDKPEDGTTPPKDAKTETTPEEPAAPQPLTKDDVTSIIKDIRTEERTSGQELQSATQDVLEAYYPDGLSRDIIESSTGKVLKTPQDVVDAVAATGGEMSMEEATQWLMNEQFRVNKEVDQIESDAKKVAETTVTFKRDAVAAVEKYEPLFKAYPQLQQKVFNLMMKQVKADEQKGVILAAPDVMDLYDTYLEPYQLAYEHQTKQSATNPTKPEESEAPTPGAEDRLEENGDGGTTEVDDPNDFAQQVTKELNKGI